RDQGRVPAEQEDRSPVAAHHGYGLEVTEAAMTSRPSVNAALLLLMPLLFAGRGAAAQPGAGRSVVGECVGDDGTIFRREAPEKPWHLVKHGEALHAGDLLLGLPGAILASRDASVRLAFAGDLSNTTALSIIESAVVLHASKG